MWTTASFVGGARILFTFCLVSLFVLCISAIWTFVRRVGVLSIQIPVFFSAAICCLFGCLSGFFAHFLVAPRAWSFIRLCEVFSVTFLLLVVLSFFVRWTQTDPIRNASRRHCRYTVFYFVPSFLLVFLAVVPGFVSLSVVTSDRWLSFVVSFSSLLSSLVLLIAFIVSLVLHSCVFSSLSLHIPTRELHLLLWLLLSLHFLSSLLSFIFHLLNALECWTLGDDPSSCVTLFFEFLPMILLLLLIVTYFGSSDASGIDFPDYDLSTTSNSNSALHLSRVALLRQKRAKFIRDNLTRWRRVRSPTEFLEMVTDPWTVWKDAISKMEMKVKQKESRAARTRVIGLMELDEEREPRLLSGRKTGGSGAGVKVSVEELEVVEESGGEGGTVEDCPFLSMSSSGSAREEGEELEGFVDESTSCTDEDDYLY